MIKQIKKITLSVYAKKYIKCQKKDFYILFFVLLQDITDFDKDIMIKFYQVFQVFTPKIKKLKCKQFVLLILAGVTIATLTGDNGILAQASRAKQESQKASIIEQIRLDIMEKQTENEGIIYDEDFYQILENYGSISNDETTLTTTKGNYKILISDIYSGKLQKNWENKVISAIGDSITDGFGSSDGMDI